MEGGVGIFLILVIVVVAIVGAIALYVTGGAILVRGERKERPPRGKIDLDQNKTSDPASLRESPSDES